MLIHCHQYESLVLMTRKTKALYKAVLEHVKIFVQNFIPESVMAGFEDAAVLALKEVFGNYLMIKGCSSIFQMLLQNISRQLD
jgi:hypothetical protein